MNAYFSHDSNARNSEKLLAVRMTHGAAGYGIYFMLLERLRNESDYTSVKDYNMIAFDLRVSSQLIKAIVEDFGLFAFTEDGKRFYSESFSKRMSIKDETKLKLSAAGRKGMERRWSEANNEVIATLRKSEKEVITGLPKSDNEVITRLPISDNNKRKESKVKKDDDGETPAPPSISGESLKKNEKGGNKARSGAETLPEVKDTDCGEKTPQNGQKAALSRSRRYTFGENVAECLASTEWQEMVQMNLGVRITDWQDVFAKFRASLVANGHDTEKTLQDFRQHFVNWFRISINEKTKKRTDDGKNQKNISGNDRARVCTSIGGEAYSSARIVPPGRGVSVL